MTVRNWDDPRVALSRVSPGDYSESAVRSALVELSMCLDWGSSPERLFSKVIPQGGKVLIKPNWVHHFNAGEGGLEPLLSHASVIKVVAEAALASSAGEVRIGDAPLQSCDFTALVEGSGLGPWFDDLKEKDPRLKGPEDFRRTHAMTETGIREAYEDLRPETDFVLFDLASESLLEPISHGEPGFRVTQYDPRLLGDRHHVGKHQYLVARAAIEADVVINLPKLKTHKKAGITCALKNLIGINGNKEFLPHHRLGGSAGGGDCYQGDGHFRLLLEKTMDRYNMASSPVKARGWRGAARLVSWLAKRVDGSDEIEGAWSGNDTIWRTCLDLNRILLYGTVEGVLAPEPQRQEIHVVDAITAGQGDGPLTPDPLPLGLLLAGWNAAAVDWIASQLLQYDPRLIPISRGAFDSFRWPLSTRAPEDVRAVGEIWEQGFDPGDFFPGRIVHPAGWKEAGLQHELQVGRTEPDL